MASLRKRKNTVGIRPQCPPLRIYSDGYGNRQLGQSGFVRTEASSYTMGALPEPPPGLDLNETKVPSLVSAFVVTWVLGLAVVGLRITARRLSRNELWWDDWLIIVSLVCPDRKGPPASRDTTLLTTLQLCRCFPVVSCSM